MKTSLQDTHDLPVRLPGAGITSRMRTEGPDKAEAGHPGNRPARERKFASTKKLQRSHWK